MVGSNLCMCVIRIIDARSIVDITVAWPFALMNTLIVSIQSYVMATRPFAYMLISGICFIAVCVVSFLDIYPSIKVLKSVITRKNEFSDNR